MNSIRWSASIWNSTQQGIKIHKTADPAIIAATRRLHAKGLLTQADGGYLTSLGRDAAEHAQAALTILSSLCSAVASQTARAGTRSLNGSPA
jgi:uncharacterized protein (TIGR02647 family)